MSQERDRLALLAAAATGIQVGAALVASRTVVHDIGPASLALLRYAIAVCCLLPPLLAMKRTRFALRDLFPIMGLGIVQFGILVALLNFGLRYIPSGRAALLFSTFPLMTMLVAASLGREHLTGTKTAGVVLTLIGVGATLGESLLTEASAGEWIGATAVLAAALFGAVCSVLYRPYLARYPTLPVGALAMLASVAFLVILAGAEGFFAAPPRLTVSGWSAVVFIGLSSGIGYILWLWALKQTTPTRVTAFLSLSPVTAAVFGVWLLGEPATPGMLVGIAGVACGLWLVTRGVPDGKLSRE